jgi:hypothetical protein
MAALQPPTFQQPSAPAPVVPIGVPSEQYLLGKNQHNSITVPLVENLLGGLGTAIGTFSLALALHQLTVRFFNYPIIETPGRVLVFCFALGGIAFGALSVVHFFSDEIRKVYGIASARKLDLERSALLEANKGFIQRIRELEDQISVSGRYSALALAERLLREYFHYKKPFTRDACIERGWSRSDWQLSYNHLRNAGVVDGRGMLLVETFELGMAKALQATQGRGSWVRSLDGDFVKTNTNQVTDDGSADEAYVEKPKPVRQFAKTEMTEREYPSVAPKRGRPPKATLGAQRYYPDAKELGL